MQQLKTFKGANMFHIIRSLVEFSFVIYQVIITLLYVYSTFPPYTVIVSNKEEFCFPVHTSDGIQFTDGPSDLGNNSTGFESFEGKVKTFAFSEDGKKFAWIADGQ